MVDALTAARAELLGDGADGQGGGSGGGGGAQKPLCGLQLVLVGE
jgi:hypothetical protein